MHVEAFAFIAKCVRYIDPPAGVRVLEFGAHDVNGSPRGLFPNAMYSGVDPWPGRGVDVVSKAQDFDGGEQYDVVITAETMEHDNDAQGQITASWKALRPGGCLIVTAASEPRLPHRCDGFQGELNGEHYANIDPLQLWGWLKDWNVIVLEHEDQHGDVYALAVKP